MTQTEGNKIAALEAEIKDIAFNIQTLKEFLIEKINAQEKAVNIGMLGQKEATSIAMVASEKAIVKAEIANDLRFGEMNKKISESIESINSSIKALTESQNLNSGSKAGVKDFRAVITWVITIVGFFLMYFVLKGSI